MVTFMRSVFARMTRLGETLSLMMLMMPGTALWT